MKIKFSKHFYKKEAIINAKKAYEEAGVGSFEVVDKDGDIEVTAQGINKEAKEFVKKEFNNYVLSEMKELI